MGRKVGRRGGRGVVPPCFHIGGSYARESGANRRALSRLHPQETFIERAPLSFVTIPGLDEKRAIVCRYSSTVTKDPHWYAHTVAIADPGPLDALLPADPDVDWVAWLRHGEGFVGLGAAVHHVFPGESGARMVDARWRDFCAHATIDNELPDVVGTGPLAFSSLPFDPRHTTDAAVLMVPALIVGRQDGRAWLTRIAPSPGTPVLPPAQAAPLPPSIASSAPASLDAERWQAAVARALGLLDESFTKVVLARAVDVRAGEPIDARYLASFLAGRYPTCWTFHADGLVGASPELLIRLDAGQVTSRVLAGTIHRDTGDEKNLRWGELAQELTRSSKNLVEHELAVESVAAGLAPYCSDIVVPLRPSVLELPNVLHLASDITGDARPGVSVLRLADALHPSAAVCGTPTPRARATIARLEHLDRGRYAGPVGWMDASGDGEFAIALRCGQLSPDCRTIRLYAGCGIVSGSDPAAEYAETQAKLLPMQEALQSGDGSAHKSGDGSDGPTV